jgi:RNA-directed DNA polymerase
MAEVEKEVADGRVIELLRAYLKAGIFDGLEEWTPDEGTPQGAVISPLLANIYLHPVDIAMAAAGCEMVRYADDFVVMCRSQTEAEDALHMVRELIEERGLTLHPEKTRIVDATQRGGFDFLGYHFERGYRWPRKKSMKKLRDALRAKTKRNNGNSLTTIIENINPTLKGWFGYFKHSHRNVFTDVDGWVRMRLRSILRRRHHGRGRGRGNDHLRWPNSFFREAGLFSMQEARTLLCRSR